MRHRLIVLASTFCLFSAIASSALADDLSDKMKTLCDSGNGTACFEVAERLRTVDQNVKEALPFYLKACDTDYMTACTNAGILTQNLGQPSSEEWKKAAKLFEKSCNADEDRACFNLGSLKYREGRTRPAKEYFKKACDLNKNNVAACENLKRLSD